ncbi:ATP-binding protein [Metabacillus iocasae]|uniref:histidine kinase n=1 Tax=Priestia iocasae TaxID=2291674 RepID=A0ABS2QSR5_9BACI|nr:ATP-binding protein [Metabacillus iocasae]MBM7702479.1 PAS domain S-box-containing protein [Metabacillus iocasae]
MVINKSFSKQFLWLIGTFFILFVVGMSTLLGYESYIANVYQQKNALLEQKEASVRNIDDGFEQAILQSRGYVAFSNKSMLNEALEQDRKIELEMERLQKLISSQKDLLFMNEVSAFHTYYFRSLLPNGIRTFEEKGLEDLQKLVSTQQSSIQIADFRAYVKEYSFGIDKELESNFNMLVQKLNYSQWFFVGYLLLVLGGLFYMARVMVRRIGQPLQQLAETAEEIASGKHVSLPETNGRLDEVGVLTNAFSQMVKALQTNEEEVMAQNEELIAQQDELQSQQDELQHALTIMQQREFELESRNEFTYSLADTLDQQKLLQSVVTSMAEVLKAHHGLVVSMKDLSIYASFGLTNNAVSQFMKSEDNGYILRAKEQRKSFTIKRLCKPSEKMYHEGDMYIHDLIIPVLSVEGEVIACMAYSRYNRAFSKNDLEMCEVLSKQVSIALEKINVYEETEHDRSLYQDILNSIHEGVQLFSQTGSILQVNTTMCELFKCPSPKEMLNHTFDQWSHKLLENVESGEELVHYMRSVLQGKSETGTTFTYKMHLNKKRRVMKVYSEEVYRNNQKYGFVFVHRDITKEYEVDEMKSEFVSTVSHELRTPLASVLGFTELMINKELKPERQKKYLTTIYQEAKRLTSLINDFLDVQRMEAGKQTYEKKYEDVLPIIKEVIQSHQVHASSHTVDLVTKVDHTVVLGDRDKLIQVFNNLISNAVKYSPDGGRVTILVYKQERNLCIDIKDEGIGIPKDSINQLFTKFYRVDNSDMRKIGGTGLGLAIVKEIVKAHDGDITVQSEVKKGSTFTVTLPLAEQLLKEEIIEVDGDCYANVVIVEDDQSLATLLQVELKESGFSVQYFSNGEDALSFIEASPPQAIVLDIMLKEDEIDGWKILERVKQNKELATIPIFISSALDEREKGLALGAHHYLVKPYQPSRLSKVILQTLLNKQEQSGQIMIPEDQDL